MSKRVIGDPERQLRCLTHIMRPIVKFAMRRTQSYQDFCRVAKQLYFELAQEELEREGKKIKQTSLSLITGLNRAEIQRLQKEPKPPEGNLSIIVKVIGQWQQDKEYTTKKGDPRLLSYGYDESEFTALVNKVTSHIAAPAVLKELHRVGAVEESPRGLKLLSSIKGSTENPEEAYQIIGKDIEALCWNAEVNVMNPQKPAELHLRTDYDNIRKDKLDKVRRWLVTEGKRFHKRAREYLSSHDVDLAPELETDDANLKGGKVSLTTFSLAQDGE